MEKEVIYKGYTTVPSDYECQDGPLAHSLNLIAESGHLRPLYPPTKVWQIPQGQDLVWMHSTSTYSHYVLQDTLNKLWWVDKDDDTIRGQITMPNSEKLLKVTSVGNMILAMTESGLHYLLWDDGAYKYIGQRPPDLGIQFGVSALKTARYDGPNGSDTQERSDAYRRSGLGSDDIVIGTDAVRVRQGSRIEFTQAVWALINKANALVAEQGHFYAPFYVRACYRMYDGSLVGHSAPVFMPLSMPEAYHVAMRNMDVEGENVSMLRYKPNNVALTYLMDAGVLSELRENWRDVVKSVEIYVSLPMLRENDGKEIERLVKRNDEPYTYRANRLATEAWDSNWNICCDIPKASADEYKEKIESVTNFYHIASLPTDGNLATTYYSEVPVKTGVLPVLATQEAMTDDYKTHNDLLPSYDGEGKCITSMYAYNGRLNLAGIEERLFEGFGVGEMVGGTVAEADSVLVKSVAVEIETDYGTKRVVKTYDDVQAVSPLMLWNMPMFYPDSRARRMMIDYYTSTSDVGVNTPHRVTLQMVESQTLNAAHTTCKILGAGFTVAPLVPHTPIGDLIAVSNYATDVLDVDNIVPMPNKVYTSEMNNPYYFPPNGMNTVGGGTILGIATATAPMSQGQFGLYPLYVFASDGVWSMELSDTGLYKSVKPVSRDICDNMESITQTDDDVYYCTSRGIMRLHGREAKSITDGVIDDDPSPLTALPYIEQLHRYIGHTDTSCMIIGPLHEYLEGCKMMYDYSHNRLIVYNPTLRNGVPVWSYCYVYSIEADTWGFMSATFGNSVNAYPEVLGVTTDRWVVAFGNDDSDVCKGLFVTRPIKLGQRDGYKTVRTLMQRGYFPDGSVTTVLYGSNDLRQWHLIASSKDHRIHNISGTPYKYLRIAGTTIFVRTCSLYSSTIDYENKMTNRMR